MLMKKMTPKRKLLYRCLTTASLLIVLYLGIRLVNRISEANTARAALPSSATSVSDFYSGNAVSWGFVRCLKARVPEADFVKYVENLGLSQKYDPKIHGLENDLVKKPTGRLPDWWNETAGLDNCFYRRSPWNQLVVQARWQDGWAYFHAADYGWLFFRAVQ